MSGEYLKCNLMAGLNSRMKAKGDYIGSPIPPCGDFASRMGQHACQPWLPESIYPLKTSLHSEIAAFMKYMEPTPEEKAKRQELVRRFSDLIKSFNIDATVTPVGSYVTGLYLPTSDIDMVLTFQTPHSTSLYLILHKIQVSGFASKIDDVLEASVPLIRVTDKITGIEIDLTASDKHSIKATRAVQKWMKVDVDLIKMLITVVKMFLAIRRCGTTYTGGVNSYVLVWMVVAWVKLEWPKIRTINPPDPAPSAIRKINVRGNDDFSSLTSRVESLAITTLKPNDFGAALKGFLKFYGEEFDYYNKSISIEPTPSYKTKNIPFSISSRYSVQTYLLSIFDPADCLIDMGSKIYAIKHVQASFLSAYRTLVDGENMLQAGNVEGILGKMLGGDFTNFVNKRSRLNKV